MMLVVGGRLLLPFLAEDVDVADVMGIVASGAWALVLGGSFPAALGSVDDRIDAGEEVLALGVEARLQVAEAPVEELEASFVESVVPGVVEVDVRQEELAGWELPGVPRPELRELQEGHVRLLDVVKAEHRHLPLFVDADEVELLQSPFRGGVDGLVDGVVRQARATLEGLDDAALHPGLAEVKAGLGLCRRGWWGLGRIFKKGEEPTLFRVSDDDDDDDETGGRKA
mmetsp:Transcript_1309/g.4448  ORF Transcript_1309/g.4448 Transcript_1309/m.4448 type:complete len:227 (-) Transcript_1309:674-1354(-)